MTKILATLLTFGLISNPAPRFYATIEKTDDNISTTVVSVERKNGTENYIFYIPQADDYQDGYNEPKYTGQQLDIDVAYGTFKGGFSTVNNKQEKVYLYQFKSYDNDVWWCLLEDEIGFVPEDNKPYALVFYQNGTTIENHGCPAEWDCDCYCYDDIFLGVYPL